MRGDQSEELDDDEEWYDDGDELDDDEAVHCPECGNLIAGLTDRCPTCGYWLSAADRRTLRSEGVKPWWVVLTAIVLLLIFLAGALSL